MTSREEWRRRASVALGVRKVRELERRVASLEVAVAENHDLARPLERVLADVERAVAGVIERSGTGDVKA
ncbi:MAG: hypothetical protein LT071_13240 [Nocardioides sp.]|nr:hypothetical protein [Nocardioides sp.]